MIVGNPSIFAIESMISKPYEQLYQRGLGYFVVHVGGRVYGNRSEDATLLACSLDGIRERIKWRGVHTAPFSSEPDASKIVDAYLASIYEEGREAEMFFDLSTSQVKTAICSAEIILAPDGDEAFDDGSHVLQFDVGTDVRLIAFNDTLRADSLTDVWMAAEHFYEIADEWQRRFEFEWKQLCKIT
jgi:Immunity protein 42